MGKSLTQEEVLNRFKSVHGDKYEYSKVIYIGAHDKVTIICPIHGEFLQVADPVHPEAAFSLGNQLEGVVVLPLANQLTSQQQQGDLFKTEGIHFAQVRRRDAVG